MHTLLASAAVSSSVTVMFALLLTALIICLALEEKLHAKKSVISGSFAVICLLVGAMYDILPFGEITVPPPSLESSHDTGEDFQAHDDHGGHSIAMPVYIPAIDWGVIAIILGSSVFVDVTSKSGLFTWIAIKVTKASRGDPLRLLVFYGIMTVVFSAVLNNVTAMIIVGSLTVVSLERLGIRDKLLGFLLIEGLLTNIGGLLTLISSVPNIIVGNAAGISFVTFFIKASPYVIVATAVTLYLGARVFKINRLKDAEEKARAARQVMQFDENDGVNSWAFFKFSAVVLCLFIITIACTSILPYVKDLGMGYVALSFAMVMLLRYRSTADQFYRAVDWDLLGFFMCLFAVIYVMEWAGVLTAIGEGMKVVLADPTNVTANARDVSTMLVGAAGFSSVTDNIPLAAMLANILEVELQTPSESKLWWSVIFGANLGGNITPIGSASTLVAVTIMHKQHLKMSFGAFIKAAGVFAIVQIILALAYVVFIL